MATVRWLGQSVAVAQVDSGSIDTYDAASTYKVTINGIEVSVAGDTDVATTAGNLVTALGQSTHPYFTAITWTNPSGGTITATAAVAGIEFDATLSVTGGTGTVTDFSNSTANSGPYSWDDADNWSGGSLPGASDDIVIENSDSSILFGLDTITAALNSITIFKTFTGRIGLDSRRFATGETSSSGDASEYRTDYLEVNVTTIDIGQNHGPGSPAGSGRIKIKNTKAGASTLTVYDTSTGSLDTNLPAMRYSASNASADVTVIGAPGGVGIGKDFENETVTVGDIVLKGRESTDSLYVGSGVTWSTYKQIFGTAVLDGAATATSVDIEGGTLTLEGDYTITTLTNDGGTVIDNHVKSAGNAVTTLNNTTGTYDMNQSNDAKTIATLNQGRAATLLVDPDVITITTFNKPSDAYQMETSRP